MLIIGPTPPPYMGPSIATQILLNSGLSKTFDLLHLDTSHHETLATFGALSRRNIFAALKHSVQLVSMILKHRPEVVYIPISQTTIGYFKDSIFILLSKVLGCKVVCHLRGGFFRQWLDNTNIVVRWFVRMVHSLVDAQIVLGDCLRPLFDGLVPADSIVVVPNGRDFDFQAPSKPRPQRAVVKVLFLGNVIETKGVLDVARAIPLIQAAGCEAEFLIAGSLHHENVKAELEECVRAQGSDVLKLMGPVVGQEKFDLLLDADIFVFPTYFRFEGHPWVIVEAMAAGLPIVSTNHAAIRESVLDDVNGFLVAKKSPEEIAKKVIHLCQDRDLRQRMGMASRERYEAKFTEAIMIDGMAHALRSAARRQDS